MDPINPIVAFEVHYAPLPANYPQLPLNDHDLQPAAYTQGDADETYVLILLRVEPHRKVICPDTIELQTENQTDNFWFCHLAVEKDELGCPEHQLAMIKGHVSFPGSNERYYPWQIVVTDPAIPGDDGTLGKVVMDSNILPTRPVVTR
jgi:hypothetical protein